jgi:hypothetical protein
VAHPTEGTCLLLLWTLLIGQLYLSGVRLGLDVGMHTKNIRVEKKIDYVLKIWQPFKT